MESQIHQQFLDLKKTIGGSKGEVSLFAQVFPLPFSLSSIE
jgi:hypothetical protein